VKTQTALMSESDVEKTIETFSDSTRIYDGFQNTMDINATLQNTAVVNALADQNARVFQWDQSTYDTEKAKMVSGLNEKTEVFLSFFTPERKHDNLASVKTVWKIFLDVAGRRFEGKAVKTKRLTADLQAFYPYHTRWNTPYFVTFPIPAKQLDGQAAVLTITGPIGSATLNFKAQ
jgi:hypothetical protein